MNDQKLQVIEKLKAASNVLVTVNANPSVDQLAACIALTLLLNKMDKHATAVFSGEVPSTIEFLKPEATLEKTTDSLRDFIISLDKAKADKLRYKVEDTIVKIFITPYRSRIDEKDLVFSQGDFNVDVVIALGVHQQQDLDEAIVAHGRILHDAVVVGVNNTSSTEMGTINWLDLSASSLSEMIATLPNELGQGLLDGQIATALLTGVVAETKHFGNAKTTPQTMSISANLLAAGANQQLVSQELDALLQAAPDGTKPLPIKPDNPSDGSMEIPHVDEQSPESSQVDTQSTEPAPLEQDTGPSPMSDVKAYGPELDNKRPEALEMQRRVMQPPTFGAPPSPVSNGNVYDPSIDVSAQPVPPPPILSREDPAKPIIDSDQTLSDIEAAVHAHQPEADDVDSARQAVEDALQTIDGPLEPLAALNAQPVDLDLGHGSPAVEQPSEPSNPEPLLPTEETASEPLQMPPIELPPAPPTFAEPPAPLIEAPDVQPAPGPMPAWMTPGQTQSPDQPPQASQQFMPAPLEQPATPTAFNPAANEPAPLEMSPADQPFTMPLPPSISMAPPQSVPPTSVSAPPQGPPPPPVPPPMMPPNFGN